MRGHTEGPKHTGERAYPGAYIMFCPACGTRASPTLGQFLLLTPQPTRGNHENSCTNLPPGISDSYLKRDRPRQFTHRARLRIPEVSSHRGHQRSRGACHVEPQSTAACQEQRRLRLRMATPWRDRGRLMHVLHDAAMQQPHVGGNRASKALSGTRVRN